MKKLLTRTFVLTALSFITFFYTISHYSLSPESSTALSLDIVSLCFTMILLSYTIGHLIVANEEMETKKTLS